MMTDKRAVFLLATGVLFGERAASAADPKIAQCLAASDAAIDLDNRHKLRAERAQLLACAAPHCPTDVRKECSRRVEEVSAQIPTIIFEAKDGAGNDLSAVKVTIDGEALASSLDGAALPIDPGEHVFAFETAGYPTFKKSLVIRQAQRDRHEIITFRQGASSAASEPPSKSGTDVSTSSGGGQKIAAALTVGAGVIALGIGSAYGITAKARRDDARLQCPDENCIDTRGQEAWADAGRAGNVATALFIGGAVGVAAGAVLWLTAPSRAAGSTTARFAASPSSVRMIVQW